MAHIFNKSGAVLLSTAFALGLAASPASATPKEVNLASAAQALKYCKSGKMPAGDVAYFGGTAGIAQYGSGSNCVQQIPPKGKVSNAILVVGNKVKECKLATAQQATNLCNGGGIAEWDIDYISGKTATTIGGYGYGCSISQTTGGIGNAVCK